MDIKWFLRHSVKESGFGSLAHYVQELPAVMGRARVAARSPLVVQYAELFTVTVEQFFVDGWARYLVIRPPTRRQRSARLKASPKVKKPQPQQRLLSGLQRELASALPDGGYWTPLGALGNG